MIAVLLQLGKQLLGLGGISAGAIELPQRAPRARAIHHGHRRVAHRFGASCRRWQGVEVIDLAPGEFRQHVEAPEALELTREVITQVSEQVLGLSARRPAVCCASRSARRARWLLK